MRYTPRSKNSAVTNLTAPSTGTSISIKADDSIGAPTSSETAPVLSSAVLEFDVPVLGHIKLVTALFFDLGVYLIVVGLVLDVLRSLGARIDEEIVAAVASR